MPGVTSAVVAVSEASAVPARVLVPVVQAVQVARVVVLVLGAVLVSELALGPETTVESVLWAEWARL